MSFYQKAFSGLVVLFCCILFSLPANGQTLYEMLEKAVKEHDHILAAQAGKEASEQGVRQARGARYPHLAIIANIGQEYIDPPDPLSSTSDTRNYQSLRAHQLIYDFGRTGSGVDRAKADLARSDTRLSAARQDIILRGTSAYYNVYRYAEILKLARQSEQRLSELTGIEESLVNRGAGLSSDVLQAKSQLAGAKALRARTEGLLMNARHRFKTVYGFDLTDDQIQNMSLPARPVDHLPATLDQALAAANSHSLDLHIANHNIEIARQEIRFRKSRYYPDLYLVGEGTRREDDIGIEGIRYNALGMVELTWSLFSGGSDWAAVSQARHNLSEFENRRDDLSREVREQVLVAWQNLITFRENARFLKDQAESLEEFLALATRERRLGNRSLLDVLNGEVTYINALSNAISADIDQDIAMYGMLYAMGMLELDMLK